LLGVLGVGGSGNSAAACTTVKKDFLLPQGPAGADEESSASDFELPELFSLLLPLFGFTSSHPSLPPSSFAPFASLSTSLLVSSFFSYEVTRERNSEEGRELVKGAVRVKGTFYGRSRTVLYEHK
jgi:hypothetical protein